MIRAAEPRPQINGVVLTDLQETLTAEALRQRACLELLRQAAMRGGMLATDDPQPLGGAISDAASAAIEALLERELCLPEPSDETCRRYHAAHVSHYTVGERVEARHVLFAVTPGVDVAALRQRAEACLLDLRCQTSEVSDHFHQVAAQTSNCPSGEQGGHLGWLAADDCAPEFAREIFGQFGLGVLPRLVHSRFGLHVVELLAREPGRVRPFDAVRSSVTQALRQQTFTSALRHYLQCLAGDACIEGVDLSAAASPLVQ